MSQTIIEEPHEAPATVQSLHHSSAVEEALKRDATYGNYSSDVHGGGNIPPPGLRGGKNDPAYADGVRYDWKYGGIVPDNRKAASELHHHEDGGTKDQASSGRRVSLGDKIVGSFQVIEGKVLHKAGLVREGQARKSGHADQEHQGSTGDTTGASDSRQEVLGADPGATAGTT